MLARLVIAYTFSDKHAEPGRLFPGRLVVWMWYVYVRYLKSGREDCVNRTFDTAEAAVKHIARCYAIDKDLGQLGENYYFMKKH